MSVTRFPHGTLHQGDSLEVLRTLPDASAHCCVTSPPYWGLRDYGTAGQIGLEETPDEYVARLLEVFGEVRRVLRDDGSLWLNLGDAYTSNFGKRKRFDAAGTKQQGNPASIGMPGRSVAGLPPKNLIGLPWRVAFALQAAGWYLRCDIIWAKPNPMPESVQDRPTRAHEYLFLLTKSEKYFYDHEAVREPAAAMTEHDATGQGYRAPGQKQNSGNRPKLQHPSALTFAREVAEPDRPGQAHSQHRPDRTTKKRNPRPGVDTRGGGQGSREMNYPLFTRNRRSVWTIPTEPFPGAHYATFPTELVRPCILAGCPMGGTVLDPFFGSGTVGEVARMFRRQWIGIEISPNSCAIAARRVERLPTQKSGPRAELPLLRMLGT